MFLNCIHEGLFSAVEFCGFWQIPVFTCPHYSMILKNFTFSIFSFSVYQRFILPLPPLITPLQATDLLIVSIVLPFPEWHIMAGARTHTHTYTHTCTYRKKGNIYVEFSDWLLFFSNVHLQYIHVFVWQDPSFHFKLLNKIPSYECKTSLCVCVCIC